MRKLEDEWRPSKLQNCWEWPEYIEESWRLEEICCHSNSSERPSAKTHVKNSQGVNNNNNNNNDNNNKESWGIEEICCHSNSSERSSANTDVKNSQGVIIIIINFREIPSCWREKPRKEKKKIYLHIVICFLTGHWPSGWVFANGPGDLGSIPGPSHTKNSKNGTWCLLA